MTETKHFFVLLQLGDHPQAGPFYWVEDRAKPETYQEELHSILSEPFIQRYGFVKVLYTFYENYEEAKKLHEITCSTKKPEEAVTILAVAKMSLAFQDWNVFSRFPCERTHNILKLLIRLDYYRQRKLLKERKLPKNCCPLCWEPFTEEEKRIEYHMPILDLARCGPNKGYPNEGRVYRYRLCCENCVYGRKVVQGDRRQWTTEGYLEVDPRTNTLVKSWQEIEKEEIAEMKKEKATKLRAEIEAWTG